MEKLIAVGVPAGAVFDTLELQNEPSFEERGFMQHVHHHNGDDKMATWPVRIDGKTHQGQRRAGARRRHRRGAGELARDRFRRVRQSEDRRRTLSEPVFARSPIMAGLCAGHGRSD